MTDIRYSTSSENLRIVIQLDAPVEYTALKKDNDIIISMPNTTTDEYHEKFKIWDGMFKDFSFSKTKTSLNLFIETSYPVKENIFPLKDPFRIVIDIPRQEATPEAVIEDAAEESVLEEAVPAAPSKNKWLYYCQKITDGLNYLTVSQDDKKNRITASVLFVDPSKVDVTPVISVRELKGRDGGPIFGALFDAFSGVFGGKPEPYSHFAKKRVSAFVKAANAFAGINGSYFFGSSTPVGVLIINGQIISSPLYNRTALVIYRDGRANIDSVIMEGYLKLKNGETLGFSGVNQPINKNEIMVYTPDYQRTDPSGSSTNIIVSDGKVTDINYGETSIPKNGFVISANGIAGEAIKERFSKGDPVKWFFMATPPLEDMTHVIAGGPRLVYDGKVYITSKEEKFRRDITSGKAARTAVGITKDNNLLFVVVESSGKNKGATLAELSQLLIELGAVEAMNLDGGGSSSMVVNGAKMNSGSERAVSNAIVIRKK
ncbi:MAG: phosphodiester glycosidase family protein [Candidatus Saganbacteria bacterium]|nr:phosphodiester glycosidase family protein [Candidatus Saganbacteria bacterium]